MMLPPESVLWLALVGACVLAVVAVWYERRK